MSYLPRPLLLLLCGLLAVQHCSAQYQWPSEPYDSLEDFLYEGERPDGSSLSLLVEPCKLRPGTNTTVAAEWVRAVYHDTATHNVNDGSGGLDGSLFFETDRVENVGAGMKNTLSDLAGYPSRYISRADVIAIATVFAVATCGGPAIPVRGGRIDANSAGPFGVPNATDTTESLTATFAQQGYNVSEMIQLVACGHTLGGVRYPDFPDIVPAGTDPSATVVDLFDQTQQFDHNIITQYLDGSTRDPLVVNNATAASDLRVFSADGNVTMQSMSTADAFAQTCTTIFDKMLNNVPSSVTLTDVITLQPVKVSGVQLTVGTSQLQFQAAVRLADNATSVQMYWCDRYGSGANCAGNLQRFAASGSSSAVTSPVSTTMNASLKKYQFVVPIDPSQSIAKFWFIINYANGTTATADNNGAFYTIAQDDVLWVPSMSKLKSVTTGQTGTLIVAAVKNTTTPTRVYADCFGRATTNYLPVNATHDLTLNSSIPARAGYNFYTGTATEDFGATMQFDLFSVAQDGTSSVDNNREANLIGVSLAPASTVNSTTSGSTTGHSGARRVGSGDVRWGLGLAAGVALGMWACL